MKPTGVILAGGKSRRMGRPKALLPWRDATLIEEVAARIGPETAEILVVTNDPGSLPPLEARLVGDIFPGRGPLGGLHSGLYHSRTPWILLVACDQPFISPPFLRFLSRTARATTADAVVPSLKEGLLEPLQAAYNRRMLPRLTRWLEEDRSLKVTDFYPEISVRYVPPAEWAFFGTRQDLFFNINTPEDLEQARREFGEGETP